MPERDGYIPGVPCWVDTNQPDPEAAAAFYGGLFGWEIKDVMPPESGGTYLVGEIRGGSVAAVSSIPEGAPPMAMWNTYIDVASADEAAAKVVDAGGRRSWARSTSRTPGGWRCSPIPRARRSASGRRRCTRGRRSSTRRVP